MLVKEKNHGGSASSKIIRLTLEVPPLRGGMVMMVGYRMSVIEPWRGYVYSPVRVRTVTSQL